MSDLLRVEDLRVGFSLHGHALEVVKGVNFVDINGDGWLDIYILKTGLTGNFKEEKFTTDGANLLYINQKDNT